MDGFARRRFTSVVEKAVVPPVTMEPSLVVWRFFAIGLGRLPRHTSLAQRRLSPQTRVRAHRLSAPSLWPGFVGLTERFPASPLVHYAAR